MAHPARKFEQPHERATRLHALGLDEETLREAVTRGFVHRQASTAFHPPSFPGYSQWAETIVASRELLIPRDWTFSDANNLSRVVSPDSKVAVIVSTGDDNTARSEYRYGEIEPRTKHPKGTETRLAVEANDPPTLFDALYDEKIERIIDPEPERQATWMLLIAVTEHELRYELSLPKAQDDKGYVCAWSERIIFPPIEINTLATDADGQNEDEDGIDEIDVPVERI